jgi:uncharacterized protein
MSKVTKQPQMPRAVRGVPRWSKYNCLFRLESQGGFVYNSLSGVLIELDEPHYRLLESLKSEDTGLPAIDSAFQDLLKEKSILIDSSKEEGMLLVHQRMRHAACFDTSSLTLTICPTLACNFRCAYCFEPGQKKGATMTDETEGALIRFIRKYKHIRYLDISWFGGEPLLEFDRICSLTSKFEDLGIPFNATLITNGYLLDKKKIDRFNDLKITSIQVTLDGPKEVHNTRRILKGGKPTYDRIIGNVATLLGSSYKGDCIIRVNTDRHNMDEYIGFRTALLEKFGEKAPAVYPGHVHTSSTHPYDCTRCLNNAEWSDFTLDLFNRGGISRRGGFFPGNSLDTLCVATGCQGFVVGPEGELYKCWEEVGRPEFVIGSISSQDFITDPVLEARYTVGTDPFTDQECRRCTTLPICGGGCTDRRMKVRLHGEKGMDICSPYKHNLANYLKAYIQIFQANEVCAMMLDPSKVRSDRPGFRIISPMSPQDPEAEQGSKVP